MSKANATMIRVLGGMSMAAMVGYAVMAQAQDYPVKAITTVIGTAPGGIADFSLRSYADAVSKTIGQRILVENRPMSGGLVAGQSVQRADPDGYTLLGLFGAQHAMIPAVQPDSFDPINGFRPVTLMFSFVNFIVVPKSNPATTLRELIEYGRKKPGGLLFGSSGVGSASHIFAGTLSSVGKMPVELAHYRGATPIIPDLVAGRVDFSVLSFGAARPFIQKGDLRFIAVDADSRWGDAPDVPTVTEAGYPQARVTLWFGLAAPAGTPERIIQRLNTEYIKASKEQDLVKRLNDRGIAVRTSTPQEMAALLAAEVELARTLVKTLNLKGLEH